MDNNSLLYFVIILQFLDTVFTLLALGLIIDIRDENGRIYKRR